MTDLPKAYDCLDYSLLVAKLQWDELSLLFLNLIFSNFDSRTHCIKIKECSYRLKIEYGVPQGSILVLLLFNINSIDIFYECKASDIGAPYACVSDINPIQYEPFRGCSRMGEGRGKKRLPPSLKSVSYTTLMKLGTVIPYQKKIQKIHISRDTPLELC